MEENEKKKNNKVLILILLVISSVLIAFIIISPYVVLYKAYQKDAKNRVSKIDDSVFKGAQSSIVYDKDDNEIVVFKSDEDMYYTTSDKLPQVLKDAFVVLTDKNFFTNGNADTKTLIPIVKDYEKASKNVKGVSPLTRNMARELLLADDVDEDNMVTEVYVANELQKKYTRDQIFEFYVNNIYFSKGMYGIAAAAKGLFDCEVDELTVSQIAFLAAIAESPGTDIDVHLEDLLVKRNVIITSLLNDKKIDNAEYYRAISEEIRFIPQDIKKNNYVESYVINDTITSLMKNDGFVFQYSFDNSNVRYTYQKEYDKAYSRWEKALYRNGYRIYTDIDMTIQDNLQKIIDEQLSYSNETNGSNEAAIQGSLVCIDNSNGMVVAVIGGRSIESVDYVLNRAFRKYETAGRTILPLNAYIPFIQWHHNPDYIVYQEEAVDGTLINKVTLKEAVLKWDDDFPKKVYENIKPSYGISLLERIGFARANDSAKDASAYGSVYVSPLELAVGYATMANDGTYINSGCVKKIEDCYGQQIYTRSTAGDNVFAANDTRIMNEMLAINMQKDGILAAYAPENAVTAGLNSTVNDGNSSFFAGFSRYYTVVSLVDYEGLNVNSDRASEITSNAAEIWKKAMVYLHKDKELKEFEKSGPYSKEPEAYQEILQPTTEQPSLGGTGGHPGDGDDLLH